MILYQDGEESLVHSQQLDDDTPLYSVHLQVFSHSSNLHVYFIIRRVEQPKFFYQHGQHTTRNAQVTRLSLYASLLVNDNWK